jgi:hypothetical protein
LYKSSYFGAYECSTGSCYPDEFYNSSNFPEYVQIKEDEVYRWSPDKAYTAGYSVGLYIKDNIPMQIDNNLFLGEMNDYDQINNSTDSLFLLSNNTLQRIHWVYRSSLYRSSGRAKTVYYYRPFKGQLPPANWPQKIRTDSTLRSDVQGEWALFTLTTDDSNLTWKDDSIKYSLSLKNDSGFIFYNDTQLLSIAYSFRNFSLDFFPPFLKIDTLENLKKPTCISDFVWSMESSAYVSDNLDTIVFANGLYHYWTNEYCFSSRYYFKRVPPTKTLEENHN